MPATDTHSPETDCPEGVTANSSLIENQNPYPLAGSVCYLHQQQEAGCCFSEYIISANNNKSINSKHF